ncbi:MAG: proline iminopeptidase-family hydrolase [Acidobacteriota bacterium]
MTAALLLLLTFAQTRDGFLSLPDGPIWYRIHGDGKQTPLVVLHGGPGGTSCSLFPLAAMPNRKVVFYDQLGSGRSGRPADRRLWNVDRFVEELHSLRQKLGLKRMHLLGHSWGGALAAAYVLSKGSAGIDSLILASPLINTEDWLRDAAELKKQLPAATQQAMAQHEAAGTTDHPEYRAAEAEFTRRFVVRKSRTLPAECADSSFNRVIYQQMWGPTEFHATGSLQSFNLSPRLSQLRLPVLFVVGEFDEARPATAARYRDLIPGAQLKVIPDAAHALFSDNPAATLSTLRDWLK